MPLKTVLFTVLAISLFSCQPVEPTPNHEEELITTLNISLTSNGVHRELSFKDIDGDGGNPPVVITDTLTANTLYYGTIRLYNESEVPAEEITPEVFDEAESHQLFYSSTGQSTFEYADQDNNGNPLGLVFELSTGGTGTESFTITLRHEPNKTDEEVQQGDITNAGGETDIEVVFEVTIE